MLPTLEVVEAVNEKQYYGDAWSRHVNQQHGHLTLISTASLRLGLIGMPQNRTYALQEWNKRIRRQNTAI